ncbi:molybdopterin-synthase adenylyltransferase MoeB [Vibrio sp. RC27]
MSTLTDSEMLRYSRQINLTGFDFEGQEALKSARVLVVGVGGLGCATTPYLVSAGIGHLTIVDDDQVEFHNLQRQVLHGDQDVGRDKVESARDSLLQINNSVSISAIAQRLHDGPMMTLIKQHDIVVDCCDNLATRNQLNKLCHSNKTPLVSGAAIRMEGQVSVYTYQPDTPCYQCFSQRFGEQNLSCVTSGILAPVVGVIGSMQAIETIKMLTGYGEVAQSKVMLFDALYANWRELKLSKLDSCAVCGDIQSD